MTKTIYIKNIAGAYPKLLKELENYTHYCLRVLHRCRIHPTPEDFTFLSFQRVNGQLAEAVCYPTDAVTETSVENPLFFYGFKADYDFSNLELPVRVTFCDNFEELIK